MKKNFIISALTVAFIATTVGVLAANQQLKPAVASDKAVAEFLATSLPDTAGKSQALAQWKGKILVVNFWATWCAPCVKEMPELSDLQKSLGADKVQLLGVGIDGAEAIAAFSKKHAISYPLFVAGMDGSELSSKLGNSSGSLPYTALIGRDGKIVKTYLGSLKMDVLRADIKKLGG